MTMVTTIAFLHFVQSSLNSNFYFIDGNVNVKKLSSFKIINNKR